MVTLEVYTKCIVLSLRELAWRCAVLLAIRDGEKILKLALNCARGDIFQNYLRFSDLYRTVDDVYRPNFHRENANFSILILKFAHRAGRKAEKMNCETAMYITFE